MTNIENVNNRLEQTYGKHVEADKPKYRIVLAGNEVERREGEFWVSEGGIHLSLPVREVRTVKKYEALFADNQIVLEILTWIPRNMEIAEGYTYEPLWAFPPGLPIKWEAIQLVLYHYINKIKSNNPRNQKEADYQEQSRLARNKAIIKNRLDNTALQSALHDGDAVSFVGVENKEDLRKPHMADTYLIQGKEVPQ